MFQFPKINRFAAIVIGLAMLASPAIAEDISGAGATFPYPVYSKWAAAYKDKTGTGLNYQPIGSGGGIKQIEERTVTFGASDKPLSGDQLKANKLVQFPTVMGGIVPVVNLKGIAPGQIYLSGPVLAKIYLGQITQWNDPAIAALNPGLNLPKSWITVVHRSDGSGTTFNFTNYLSKVSTDWKSKVGEGTAVQWPVGLGAKGNEGVAANVSKLANSIGYVEYAYALQNHMTHTGMVNAAGKKVEPTASAFAAAAANADWSAKPGFGIILSNQPGDATWPMTAATFILVPASPKSPENAAEALRFFDWAYVNGDDMAAALDYIPMPDNVVTKIKAEWSDIQKADGTPVLANSTN